MEAITAFLIGLTAIISAVGTLLVTLHKTKKQIEETIPVQLRRRSNLDTFIIAKMEALKELLDADRVQIYDFHNGGHYANGRSALKTTCTYEVVRAGIKGCQMLLQAVPLSCIAKFTNILLEEGELFVANMDTIASEMPSTYSIKTNQGVQSFFDVILENKNKEPIGFLGVQFVNKQHKRLTDAEKLELYKLKFVIEENLELMIKKTK